MQCVSDKVSEGRLRSGWRCGCCRWWWDVWASKEGDDESCGRLGDFFVAVVWVALFLDGDGSSSDRGLLLNRDGRLLLLLL